MIVWILAIQNSDLIYVVDKGQIIDHGKHDELLKTSATYKNFYEKQLKDLNDFLPNFINSISFITFNNFF